MAEFSFKMAELVTIIAQFGPKNAELGSIMDKLDSKIAKIAKLQSFPSRWPSCAPKLPCWA